MWRKLDSLFSYLWPFGLVLFFLLISLSFSAIPVEKLAVVFGLSVVACASLAWLLVDSISASQRLLQRRLEEMEDLLKPYEGMKLSQMPPDVQAEVRRRLGWTEVK